MGIEELQKKQNSAATIHTEAQKEVTNVRTFVRNPAAVNVINENEGTDILAGKTEEQNVINLPLPIQTVPKEALKKAPKAIKNVVYREQPKRQLSRKERLLKYTEAEKNARMKLLSDNDIPVPKDRDELVTLRNMHMEVVNLTDEAGNLLITEGPIHHEKMIRQDYQWKDKTSALIKENYDWLMQYYLSQDDTLESNWDLSKAVPEIKFEEHESKIETEGMDGAYEKQKGLNCYCCTGAALINQFIAKRKNAPVDNRYANQDKLRSYVPNVRKYDPATADLLDENGYEGNLRGIDESAGAERHDVGNLFDIGDCIFDTLKENNIENAMLNKMVMDVPTLNKKKGDNKRSESKYNNMLAVFANKISEVTNSGSAVGLQMVGSGISHYVTITAIKGRQLTVYDSSGYGGKPKIKDISDYVKRGVVVELTWISDMKKPEEMTEEYKNLAYDEENGYSVKEQNVRQLSASLTHTKGVTVMKDDKELGEAYEGIVMYSYIPESKKHVDTAPLRTVLSDLDLKKPRRMLNKSAAAFREEAEEKKTEEAKEEQEKQPVPEKEEEKQEENRQEEEKKAEEKEQEKTEEKAEKQEEKLPAPSPEALQRREERRRQKRIDKVLDRQRKRKAKEEELEYTIQALSDQLEKFEKEKLSEKDASLIKNSFKNDIKSKQKELERLRKENKKADQEDIRNYEKGLKKEKDGTVTKKYERDYAAFGLGVSLNNTKIEETDSTEMARIKAALKDYLEIRKKYFNKYQLSEMSAEKFLERGTGFAGVQQKVDIYRSLKKEERAELGDAYMVLREATRNYERTHLHMFKFGRGKARFRQVRLLKEKIEMDNMRFHLSDYRQSILNSLDSKYENDHLTFRKTVMPTWGHYLHLGNKIDLRNQAYRDKRRRQKEEGKLPAWYKRAWSWTKTGMKNTGLRALMGYEAAGGLIDRTLGLATATVANTLNLTGKVVKTPLKLASCLFNGVSKLVGSKKRWRVNNDPTEGWSGIDDGRKIFRRYLKGLCIIPQAMIEPIYRGVPRLWGHKYKHGVFKLSSRWAKDIWQDVRKVGENLGIKNYDAISVRADEDFLTAESPLYQADAGEQTKVEGFETSGIEVLDDVRKRKTGMDTEGDKLLDALNADRCETIKALIEKFGANRLEKEKDMLSQNIMYCGMNDARELKGVSDYATQEWSFLKNSTRNQVFEVKFDEFRYQNEEEFKKNFVKNYKKLQYFDLMYEEYFGEKKDPDFANRGLPEGHYGAEFYERLKLIHLIKEDYDRRIEKLQGWEIPKQKKTGFWMGMDSQALEDYLNKNVEKNGKADAKRQSDMADKIITEYTAYCEKNKEKYKDNMDDENVYPPESMFDFMKMKAEKLPVPKFTDEELSNETLLTADYDQGFNLGGVDIANEQRMIVNFKNSREFKKLPARLRRAYSGELEKYRERRREYEKRCNLEKIYQEYSMELPGSTDFSIRRDGVTFNKNPYFDEDQQYPIQYLNAVMNRVDPGLIRRNGEVDQMAPESNTKLFQDAQEFTNFRMKHGICLTKDDKRWKMLEKFEKDFVVPENLYVTVRINCNGKVTEMRTIRAFEEKDLNLNIEAKSEEELNTIREELAEQEKLMRKVQSYAVFMQKNVGLSGEIKGVMGSEFDALRKAMFEKAKAISGYYLKKDDKEAKKAYIEGKLEAFEAEGDVKKAGDFVLKCYSKAEEGNPEEREAAVNYLKNLEESLAAAEEVSEEEKKYVRELLRYVKNKGDQTKEDAAKQEAHEAKQRAIFAPIKVRGLEVSDMPVINDILKRKTPDDTEGDRLLDDLNADRLETIDALAERFGKDRLEKVKGDLTYTILYSGMNNARELKRISDEPVKNWGTLKDFTRGELFDIDFNAFCYQNEKEFKKNFVKNYKKLQYFDLMYEDYFGKNKDSDFINQAMPGNHYGAEFYERLKLVRSIKEDYDRRIELLQEKEVPKEKKTGFRMGMNSQALNEYLNKKIEKSAKSDANRQADLAKRVMKEYTAFRKEKKYAEDSPESVFDFMKMKAEKLPVPEFTDEQLSTEMLDTFYSDFFNVRGSEISEEQRMIVDFKNSDEFKKLPAKLQKAFTRELEKYRERRREYEKKRNLEKIYEEYAMTYADGTDFDIGLDNTEFTKNPYFTPGQKNAIRQLNSTMSKVDWDLIRRNGDPNPDAIFNYETLYQDAQEFTNFRMKHGICLTKDDPRWKKAEEFEKSYVADEKWYITVRIKCNGVITEVRTLNAYEDKKDLNLEIEAKSEEELNKIKEELAEQERLLKKSQSNKAFKAKKLGGSSEINGVMGSEFEGLQLALYEKAKAICDYYLKKDDKEAKEDAAKQEAHEEKSEQKEQKKFDLIVKGPFVFKDYPAINVNKDKKLIKACADKFSNIIKQRETFLSDNVKLQSEEWKKMRHDSEPGGSRKIEALTGIMSYFYGDSDEEAWEFYSSLLADKKTADAALKNKKARSMERLFEHIVSFDLNRFNFKNVNEMFSEKYLDEMLTSYLTYEFPEELFEEYKEFIEDKQIDCALKKKDLDNVRFKWKILHDTTELFRLLPMEAAKQDITQEDINLALSSSGEECLKMAQKYSQTSQDKADFFNRMASVMEHMKEIGFKPTDNVCRHYHTAMLEDEEIGNFDELSIATRIQKKRRDLGLAPEDSRMTEEYFAPTLDEELDRTVKHYNGSGISKAGLQDVLETTKAMYEVSKQKDASLPVDLYRSVAKTDVLKDFDNRGLLSLLRPVKLDADGRPATDEDERNLKQNISDVNKLKENTLSARIDVLESMVSRAKSIMFTPKELKDYKFLRNNRERAVRCLQMMFSMLNLFLKNRRYFISQASAETRAFMFMLNDGSDYVPYMSFHIQNALFSQGNRIKGMGGSSWHDFRLPYDYGLDYNQMRQENKKIATQMNSSCIAYGSHFISNVQEGKFDPYEIKPEEEKDEYIYQERLEEIETLEDLATQGQHLKMSDIGGKGEKIMLKHLFKREKRKDVKEFTHEDREKIINRYMGGFKKKEYDPKLMQEINAALEEYRKIPGHMETELLG